MKGISEIIATILMLMITLALSGTAYLFISSVLTQQTQGLEIVDAYCAEDTATLIVRNLGTTSVDSGDITVMQTSPSSVTAPTWNPITIPSGTMATMMDACEGSGARNCVYRIIPPAGRSIAASIACV